MSELLDFARQAEPRGSVHHEAPEHPAQQARCLRGVLTAGTSVSAVASLPAAPEHLAQQACGLSGLLRLGVCWQIRPCCSRSGW